MVFVEYLNVLQVGSYKLHLQNRSWDSHQSLAVNLGTDFIGFSSDWCNYRYYLFERKKLEFGVRIPNMTFLPTRGLVGKCISLIQLFSSFVGCTMFWCWCILLHPWRSNVCRKKWRGLHLLSLLSLRYLSCAPAGQCADETCCILLFRKWLVNACLPQSILQCISTCYAFAFLLLKDYIVHGI